MVQRVLIIGGGTAGCSAAHAIKDAGLNMDVTILDAATELGAGVRTYFKGGHPYTFGPRHFLTQNSKTFEYLNSKIPLFSIGFSHYVACSHSRKTKAHNLTQFLACGLNLWWFSFFEKFYGNQTNSCCKK